MFSKWVENTVEKGEIARYEQFRLFPQCFQESCIADTEITGLVSERVKLVQIESICRQQQNCD